MNDESGNWQVFWLHSAVMAFPRFGTGVAWDNSLRGRTGAASSPLTISTHECYSYGDSAGLAPASLFILRLRRRNQLRGANVGEENCLMRMFFPQPHLCSLPMAIDQERLGCSTFIIPCSIFICSSLLSLSSAHGTKTKAAAF